VRSIRARRTSIRRPPDDDRPSRYIDAFLDAGAIGDDPRRGDDAAREISRGSGIAARARDNPPARDVDRGGAADSTWPMLLLFMTVGPLRRQGSMAETSPRFPAGARRPRVGGRERLLDRGRRRHQRRDDRPGPFGRRGGVRRRARPWSAAPIGGRAVAPAAARRRGRRPCPRSKAKFERRRDMPGLWLQCPTARRWSSEPGPRAPRRLPRVATTISRSRAASASAACSTRELPRALHRARARGLLGFVGRPAVRGAPQAGGAGAHEAAGRVHDGHGRIGESRSWFGVSVSRFLRGAWARWWGEDLPRRRARDGRAPPLRLRLGSGRRRAHG